MIKNEVIGIQFCLWHTRLSISRWSSSHVNTDQDWKEVLSCCWPLRRPLRGLAARPQVWSPMQTNNITIIWSAMWQYQTLWQGWILHCVQCAVQRVHFAMCAFFIVYTVLPACALLHIVLLAHFALCAMCCAKYSGISKASNFRRSQEEFLFLVYSVT